MTPMTTSDRRRRAQHMLPGFAVQVVTVRYPDVFLSDPLEVPAGPRRPAWMTAAVRNSRPWP